MTLHKWMGRRPWIRPPRLATVQVNLESTARPDECGVAHFLGQRMSLHRMPLLNVVEPQLQDRGNNPSLPWVHRTLADPPYDTCPTRPSTTDPQAGPIPPPIEKRSRSSAFKT